MRTPADADCTACTMLLSHLYAAIERGEWANVSGYALDLESHIEDTHRSDDAGTNAG